jgi:dCTP deaminase
MVQSLAIAGELGVILTGSDIAAEVHAGSIVIEPFNPSQVNPNSYNYRLGTELFEVASIPRRDGFRFRKTEVALVDGRWRLDRNKFYLATTNEIIGSNSYVTSLIGRSSIGRLGLFVQMSANIGHQGACHRWTLELRPSISIYLYPGQTLGQVSFWSVEGDRVPYSGIYGFSDEPLLSTLSVP